MDLRLLPASRLKRSGRNRSKRTGARGRFQEKKKIKKKRPGLLRRINLAPLSTLQLLGRQGPSELSVLARFILPSFQVSIQSLRIEIEWKEDLG